MFVGIRSICADCVTPRPLKELIAQEGAPGRCSYCDSRAATVLVDVLFDYILARVDENFATAGDMTQYELGMIYEGGSDEIAVQWIDVVLAEWLDLGDEPYFDDLSKYVPESYHKDKEGIDVHYFADGGTLQNNLYEKKWETFVEAIGHSHRFFNGNAETFLDSLLSFVTTSDGTLKPACVRVVRQDEWLYRARNVKTPDDVGAMEQAPARHFGPPPRERATNKRTTPNGISALYCALDRNTCLSEIRAITGENVVSIAMFPISQLKLLDVGGIASVDVPPLTELDKGFLASRHLRTFLNSLVNKLSRPRGRSDELTYLSTQLFFEYLRLRYRFQVDGLIYPSVQTGGKERM